MGEEGKDVPIYRFGVTNDIRTLWLNNCDSFYSRSEELQNKITELNKSAENAQKLYKEQIEAMNKQHETTENQVKMYEEQAKSFNENISKMQQTNVALQKSLTEITTQNAKSSKELADAKALATRLEEQLKQAERQSKPVGLYVVLVVLVAIILFLISN